MPIIDKVVPAPELIGTRGYPMHGPTPTKVIQVLVDDDGNEIVEGPPDGGPVISLPEYAAHKRWEVETGGVTVGGIQVATDDRSKVMIMGARIKADADPDYIVGWKGVNGSFVELSAPQIIAISDAVLAHVDACFAAEASVAAAVSAGTITTTQQVDDWPWPG